MSQNSKKSAKASSQPPSIGGEGEQILQNKDEQVNSQDEVDGSKSTQASGAQVPHIFINHTHFYSKQLDRLKELKDDEEAQEYNLYVQQMKAQSDRYIEEMKERRQGSEGQVGVLVSDAIEKRFELSVFLANHTLTVSNFGCEFDDVLQTRYGTQYSSIGKVLGLSRFSNLVKYLTLSTKCGKCLETDGIASPHNKLDCVKFKYSHIIPWEQSWDSSKATARYLCMPFKEPYTNDSFILIRPHSVFIQYKFMKSTLNKSVYLLDYSLKIQSEPNKRLRDFDEYVMEMERDGFCLSEEELSYYKAMGQECTGHKFGIDKKLLKEYIDSVNPEVYQTHPTTQTDLHKLIGPSFEHAQCLSAMQVSGASQKLYDTHVMTEDDVKLLKKFSLFNGNQPYTPNDPLYDEQMQIAAGAQMQKILNKQKQIDAQLKLKDGQVDALIKSSKKGKGGVFTIPQFDVTLDMMQGYQGQEEQIDTSEFSKYKEYIYGAKRLQVVFDKSKGKRFDMIQKLDDLIKVGEGGNCASIHKGKMDGKDVIVKHFDKSKSDTQNKYNFYQEAWIMFNMEHPCMPKCYGTYEKLEYSLIYEPYDITLGELVADKDEHKKLMEGTKLTAAFLGLFDLLDYMRAQKPTLFHTKINMDNIMYDHKEGKLVLISWAAGKLQHGSIKQLIPNHYPFCINEVKTTDMVYKIKDEYMAVLTAYYMARFPEYMKDDANSNWKEKMEKKKVWVEEFKDKPICFMKGVLGKALRQNRGPDFIQEHIKKELDCVMIFGEDNINPFAKEDKESEKWGQLARMYP